MVDDRVVVREAASVGHTEGRRGGFSCAEDFRAVEEVLARFLEEQGALSAEPEVAELVGWVRGSLAGGKQLRPLLCCLGWRAGGGTGPLPPAVARVAASFEMFHTFAVLHDDVMDEAETRRGRPAAQHLVAARHRGHAQAQKLGRDTAILLGDIALGWSYELVGTADIDDHRRRRVGRALATMRTQTVVGQYLDLVGTDTAPAGTVEDVGHGAVEDVGHALRIARGKTAGYTVGWPLHIGAVLAHADETIIEALTRFGLAVGEAFQLRDDLLNVFGHAPTTGKPSGDDLCHRKHTALLALAWRDADPRQRARLTQLMDRTSLDETALTEARTILTDTGARSHIEDLITTRLDEARQALTETTLPPDITTTLTDLAHHATHRDH
ncbi:polyprenyl synthetase family protein [Streptomyces aurantiacus]|uniref:polyprenyl synthetase family protein n=1 Tax=Streptomyces aurantiacus TaxID=47760 RepID=UPI0034103C04